VAGEKSGSKKIVTPFPGICTFLIIFSGKAYA
jgi:hypothetical protein